MSPATFRVTFTFFCYFLISHDQVTAKYIEGELKSHRKWFFLVRFSFYSEDSTLEYFIQFDQSTSPVSLLFYRLEDQWERIYDSQIGCQEKEVPLRGKYRQVINLTTAADTPGYPSRCYHSRRYYDNIICHNLLTFNIDTPQYWYVVLSDCNATNHTAIKYQMLLGNGPDGDYWHRHFSADEFHILPSLMVFTSLYAFLMLASLICTIELKTRHLLHPVHKLFLTSVICQCVGIVFVSASYVSYAGDGVINANVKCFGSIMATSGDIFYLTLVLLIAEGYTVTRARLPNFTAVKLTIFICFYAITYTAIYVYEAKVFDPGRELYLYESPPGYALIVLRIVSWIYFITAIIFRLKQTKFLFRFAFIGSVWFLAPPVTILTANQIAPMWMRQSVADITFLCATFWGHLTFLVATWPTFANRNFPWHVRTAQIIPETYRPTEIKSPEKTLKVPKSHDCDAKLDEISIDFDQPIK